MVINQSCLVPLKTPIGRINFNLSYGLRAGVHYDR